MNYAMRLAFAIVTCVASIFLAAITLRDPYQPGRAFREIAVDEGGVIRSEVVPTHAVPSASSPGIIAFAIQRFPQISHDDLQHACRALQLRSQQHLWTDLIDLQHRGISLPDGRQIAVDVSPRLNHWYEIVEAMAGGAVIIGESRPPLDEGLTVTDEFTDCVPLSERYEYIAIYDHDRSVAPADGSTAVRMLIPAWSSGPNSHLQRMSVSRTAVIRMYGEGPENFRTNFFGVKVRSFFPE